MEENSTFAEIGEVFRKYESFAVVSHVRPDGDAIGSMLALGDALEGMGKKVRYLNEDGCPESLLFMAGSERVEKSSEAGAVEVEVVVVLDTGAHGRAGATTLEAVKGAKVMVNLDHHVSNPGYGDFNYVDGESPATGQIVYEILTALEMPISAVSRDAMYVGISTDTGSFQYGSTTARTYEIAADLLSRGLEVGKLNGLIYDQQPERKVALLRYLLNTFERSEDGRVAWWLLRKETKEELGLIDDDSEGMIDHLRSIEGVVVAVFFEDLGGGKVRVSMRSKDPAVKVNEISGVFGGGGHSMAAGIRMDGPLEDAKGRVLEEILGRVGQIQG